MSKSSVLLALALAVPLTGCVIGEDANGTGDGTEDGAGDGTGDGTGDGDGGGDGTGSEGISGNITTAGTWSGDVVIAGGTTIAAGVTITVEPGTTIEFATGSANIKVDGTLLVNGTSAAKVLLQPRATGHGGITVGATGLLDMKYAVQTGGAIRTEAMGATVKITDTKLFKVSGDFVITNGGAIEIAYSQIGPEAGDTDTTHCQLHFNAASSIKVNNSNINGAPYGLMFYGGTLADFKSNNWYGNGTNVATQPGVTGDFSNGYFEGTVPVSGQGATITANAISPTKLAGAGVRP